jgi:hypothetical protein
METARKTLRSLAMAEMRGWEKYVTTGSEFLHPCVIGLKKCYENDRQSLLSV